MFKNVQKSPKNLSLLWIEMYILAFECVCYQKRESKKIYHACTSVVYVYN